jgi:hypothetical protein
MESLTIDSLFEAILSMGDEELGTRVGDELNM